MLEESEDFTPRQAAAFEREQAKQCVGGWLNAAARSVGDVEGDSRSVVGRNPEHRIHHRCPLGGVRNEQEQIVRVERGIGRERVEELVTHHLELPYLAVGVVNPERRIFYRYC